MPCLRLPRSKPEAHPTSRRRLNLLESADGGRGWEARDWTWPSPCLMPCARRRQALPSLQPAWLHLLSLFGACRRLLVVFQMRETAADAPDRLTSRDVVQNTGCGTRHEGRRLGVVQPMTTGLPACGMLLNTAPCQVGLGASLVGHSWPTASSSVLSDKYLGDSSGFQLALALAPPPLLRAAIVQQHVRATKLC
ncbi:hypothetical protein HDK90DRAFT_182619 [Phyllosticta capitalensis]|uniref:Uncharacterized protein n=1 Tax=Phyllosticta capitalensis TaxID=121624 RepID=A0ABR1YXA8_9PEZI